MQYPQSRYQDTLAIGISSSALSCDADLVPPTRTQGILTLGRLALSGGPNTEDVFFTAVAGNTITISIRGLSTTALTPTNIPGNQKVHNAGESIEMTTHHNYITNLLRKDETDTVSGNITFSGTNDFTTAPKMVGVNDTNNNPIFTTVPGTTPVNRLTFKNSPTGSNPEIGADGSDANVAPKLVGKGTAKPVLQNGTELETNAAPTVDKQVANKKYVDDLFTSGVGANASETAKGAVEQATLAEQSALTEFGGTGAPLFMNPKNAIKTGNAASGDEGKLPVLNALGEIDYTLLPQGLRFGGTGADGDLTITSGTTTLNLDQVYNYNNVTITSPGILAFTGVNGIAYLNIKGNFAGNGTIELRNSCTGTPTTRITHYGAIKGSNAAATATFGTGGAAVVIGGLTSGAGGSSQVAGTGAGGAGGTTGNNGTDGGGGLTVAYGGGGGGATGGNYTAGTGSTGGAGASSSGINGGNGGVGGGCTAIVNYTSGASVRPGHGGSGGGGALTGNGGTGGAAGTWTINIYSVDRSSAGVYGRGGNGGNSGSIGGNGGAGGVGMGHSIGASNTGFNSVGTLAAIDMKGGNGGNGYVNGGDGGNGGTIPTGAGSLSVTISSGGNGGNGGVGVTGVGGQGGIGANIINTSNSAAITGTPGNGGNGGDGRAGGSGGAGGTIQAYGSYGGTGNFGGTGGNGGNAKSGCAGLLALVRGNITFTGTINAQGGNGGAGGAGGVGNGNGGNGGNGSNGADVILLALGTVSSPTINVAGGAAGAAGAASGSGAAGTAGTAGTSGTAICQRLLI